MFSKPARNARVSASGKTIRADYGETPLTWLHFLRAQVYQRRTINVSQVFAGQRVGVREGSRTEGRSSAPCISSATPICSRHSRCTESAERFTTNNEWKGRKTARVPLGLKPRANMSEPIRSKSRLGNNQSRDAARAAVGPRGCSTPAHERKTESGCYTTAETPLGVLPSGSLFWHLYAYPSRAAAEAARGAKGTITESFGRQWLFTIAGESWQPAGGERIAVIGPLVVATDRPYTARYMEAVFPPGSQPVGGPGHRHPGPEAWYIVSGSPCLETPNGVITASAGGTALVPEGWPMAVSDAGSEHAVRCIVLHPSSEPYSMAIDDPRTPEAPHSHWKPRGLVGNSDTMAFHDSKPSQRTDLTALSDRRDAGICRAVTCHSGKLTPRYRAAV